MLQTGIVGIGNTGNQIALLAHNKMDIPVIAINSSEKDLDSLPNNIPKRLLKDKTGLSLGAGKDRLTAKTLLKESLNSILSDQEIISTLKNLDVLFVISSTGGGTGSGTAPLMYEILSKTFRDVKVILVGVLPTIDETLDSQLNTIGYLKEVYKTLENPTYMLYDNGKLNVPYHELLQKVNNEIIEDIDVIRCKYNFTTSLDSIDDKDAMRILSTPGRLVVSRTTGLKDKDIEISDNIESTIINNVKKSAHVELQRDKHVDTRGLIANMSQDLSEMFNTSMPKLTEATGEPLHSFKHISINEDNEPNNIFVIMSGMSFIKDRLDTIGARVEAIQEASKAKAEMDDDIFNLASELQNSIGYDDDDDDDDGTINASDIFSKFM